MKDLRNYKELIKAEVQKVNEKANWKWQLVRVNKKSIILTNGYIKGEYEKDKFSIEYTDDIYHDPDLEIECLTVRDCTDYSETFFIGKEHWDDGSVEDCITAAVRDCQRHFANCY